MRRGWVGAAVAAIVIVAGGSADGAQAPERPRSGAAPVEQAAAPLPDRPVEVHTAISRTAVWVGDPIVWTVELTCAPTVDVVADDLAAETLSLQGLELVGSETERTTGEDGRLVHRVIYQLRTYEIGLPALRVASFPVRYFVRRPGQRPEDLVPAGQVDVPGVLLAWRSTIPGGLTTLDLREQRAADPIPTVLGVARPVGLTLVVVSIAPVAFWGVSKLRRIRRPRARRPGTRASRRDVRKAIQELASAGTATESDRREAYTRLNATLRRYVAETSRAPVGAFGKIAARFTRSGPDPAAEAMTEALDECDRACYGPADRVPSADQYRNRVALLERML